MKILASIKSYLDKHDHKKWETYVDLGKDPATGKRLRPHKRGFKSTKEAELWAAEKELDFKKNGYWSKGGLTFEKLYCKWLKDEYCQRVKESTYAKTTDNFRLHILPYFGNLNAEKISVGFCQGIVNNWFKSNLKQYPRFRTYVSNVFDFGVRMELINRNPMERTSIPRQKKTNNFKIDEYYEKSELVKFLKSAKANGNPEAFMFFRLLAYTGMRKGEALALTFDDVNFEKREISINKTLSQGIDGKLILQTPKTNTSLRVISIDSETLNFLKQWYKDVTFKFEVLGTPHKTSSQLIFPNESNELAQPSLPDHWNRAICEKFKLRRIKIHAFRHTFCSLCAEGGIDIPTISKMLGHSDLKVTTEIYLHATRNNRNKAITEFAKFMSA
ncbi:MAG: site-specific integrase [Lactobacillus sp.]|nr:MAG: site-specific integrase [Lactobacillus sp.]